MATEDIITQTESEAWLDQSPFIASAFRTVRQGEESIVVDYERFYSFANLGVVLFLWASFLVFIWIGWFLLVWNNLGPTSKITWIAIIATALLLGGMFSVWIVSERKRRRNLTVPPILKIDRDGRSLLAHTDEIESQSFDRLIIVIGRAGDRPTTSIWSFSTQNRYLQLLLESENGIQPAASIAFPRNKQVESLVSACQTARVPHIVRYVPIANCLTEKLVNRAFNTTKYYR